MAKVKDKGRILKASREKQLVIYKGALIRLSADLSKKTLHARGICKNYLKWRKVKTYNQDSTTQQIYYSELKTDEEHLGQGKAKVIHHHQASITWNIKESFLKRSKLLPINDNKYISINNWI